MPTGPKTTTPRPPPFALRERFPEKARLQLFVYDRTSRPYRSVTGRHRVFVLRSEAEAERFWSAVEHVLDHPALWEE